MLQVAGKKEGVTSLCMSAEEWSAKEGKVDRVVIRGALHHFTRWQGVSSNHSAPSTITGSLCLKSFLASLPS